jgi:cell division protein FtsW
VSRRETWHPGAVRLVTLPGEQPPQPLGSSTRSGRPARPATPPPGGAAAVFLEPTDRSAPAVRVGGPSGSGPADGSRTRPWPGGFVLLLALVAVLNLIGLVMVLSASSVESLRQFGSPWYYFERQLLWLALGTAAFAVAARCDYRMWRRVGGLGLIATLLLLLAVLVPGIGIAVSGSSRWLGVGSWRVQPSELAKLAIIVYAAGVLDRRAARMADWRYSMLPVLTAFVAVAALVMAQPDMGTTMVIASIVLAALYVAGSPIGSLVGVIGLGVTSALVMALAAPYRWRRLISFLHPFADSSNTGYQLGQGLVALGSGHLAGLGLGASRASWGYLPNQHTDFIFAIVGEETGLIGSLLVVGLFAVFAVLGIRAACRAPDRYGALIAAGITAWIVAQAAINIGAVVGLLPVTGVPLPFVSFGGSSLVITMGAVGLLGNVAKQGR